MFNHLEHFPSNLGDISDEQGNFFHQDLKTKEAVDAEIMQWNKATFQFTFDFPQISGTWFLVK